MYVQSNKVNNLLLCANVSYNSVVLLNGITLA